MKALGLVPCLTHTPLCPLVLTLPRLRQFQQEPGGPGWPEAFVLELGLGSEGLRGLGWTKGLTL